MRQVMGLSVSSAVSFESIAMTRVLGSFYMALFVMLVQMHKDSLMCSQVMMALYVHCFVMCDVVTIVAGVFPFHSADRYGIMVVHISGLIGHGILATRPDLHR